MKIIWELKRTYLYFSGQSQWAPRWLDLLPKFFWPIYIETGKVHWFGFHIDAEDALPGETLMMVWRRHLIAWWKEER